MANDNADRWAVHIDIQGFAAKWDEATLEPFRGINALMAGIYRIASRIYPDEPDRLFAHQFGDAFLILSSFHETSLDRAAAITIALMRHVLAAGATCRAALSEGQLSDVVGCYPDEIRDQPDPMRIHCGMGLMTVFPVMGTALIRAVEIDKSEPRGPLLLIRSSVADRISSFSRSDCGNGLHSIDWVRGTSGELSRIGNGAALNLGVDDEEREALVRSYITNHPKLSEKWKASVSKYLGITLPQ